MHMQLQAHMPTRIHTGTQAHAHTHPHTRICGANLTSLCLQFYREKLRAEVDGRDYSAPPPSAGACSSSPAGANALSKANSATHLASSQRSSPVKQHDDWGDWGGISAGATDGGKVPDAIKAKPMHVVSWVVVGFRFDAVGPGRLAIVICGAADVKPALQAYELPSAPVLWTIPSPRAE
jgi:hypothetical protein